MRHFLLAADLTLRLNGEDGPVDFDDRVISWHGALTTLFTQYPMIGCLLVMMAIDVVTGLLAAGVSSELSSTVSYKGMIGKAMILAIVACGRVIEFVIPGVPWAQFLAIGFIITEAISITENASKAGVPIPEAWVEALQKLKQRQKAPPAEATVIVDIHPNEPGPTGPVGPKGDKGEKGETGT